MDLNSSEMISFPVISGFFIEGAEMKYFPYPRKVWSRKSFAVPGFRRVG